MTRRAFTAKRIFDGDTWHDNAAVVVREGIVEAILMAERLGPDVPRVEAGAMLAPGYVDLQVNGGDGVMFNDAPDAATITRVCRAHARLGTTALLATIVTDRPEISRRMVTAGAEATSLRTPGFLGLHLEGPHLSVARKGAHDASLIRPLDNEAITFLIESRQRVPHLLVTLAPEAAPVESVASLARADITISLGHTDARYATCKAYAGAGATMATHLFNAMSQFGSREPGLVGTVLDTPALWAGLIADGMHVHPTAIAAALRAKRGPARIFLVSDSVAAAGSDIASFMLAGRRVTRANGRLALADGTLAGADTDMAASVRYMHDVVGIDLTETLRMASTYPAEAIGAGATHGRLTPGHRADMIALSPALAVTGTWIAGEAAG
jgi:N-acetylglucosamine-6-phosphate deacetylase